MLAIVRYVVESDSDFLRIHFMPICGSIKCMDDNECLEMLIVA